MEEENIINEDNFEVFKPSVTSSDKKIKKKFKCDQCEKEYTARASLKHHVNRAHNKEEKVNLKDSIKAIVEDIEDDFNFYEVDEKPIKEKIVEEVDNQDFEPFEEEYDDEKNLKIVCEYLRCFPHILKDHPMFSKYYKNDTLINRLKSKDLYLLKEKIDKTVSGNRIYDLIDDGFFGTCKGIETFCTSKTNIKIEGFAEAISKDQHVRDCVNEIKIKYCDYLLGVNMPPEYRLMGSLLYTGYMLHLLNSEKDKVKEIAKEPVNETDMKHFNEI